ALNTYWIDYDKNTKQYLSNAAKIAAKGGVDQDELLNTSGVITEFAIAGAANFNDKVFIGGTIGLPTLRYSSNRSFLEMDPDENDATNGFNYAEFKENLTTTGAGINAKLGIVVKPTDMLRLGFTVHTPTFYTLKDNYWAYVKTDRENYAPSPSLDKVLYMASDDKAFPGAGVFDYNMRTPYKLMGSLALMFG
ncbi:MAG TPA: aromatic hydrocarbon degradation protein, partial [Niabella sp.]|nr:aromatic hydrocarbon degradation protein [Niabella sp.]